MWARMRGGWVSVASDFLDVLSGSVYLAACLVAIVRRVMQYLYSFRDVILSHCFITLLLFLEGLSKRHALYRLLSLLYFYFLKAHALPLPSRVISFFR